MLFWNLYFLIKLGLFYAGKLQLDPWLNLGFFALIVLTELVEVKRAGVKRALLVLVFAPLALALMLHEFGLVLSTALFKEIMSLFNFSTDYLIELVKRSIEPQIYWGALAGLIALRVLHRYIRTATWVGTALLVTCISILMPSRKVSLSEQEQMAAAKQIRVRQGSLAAEKIALGNSDFEKLKIARNLSNAFDANGNTSNDPNNPSQILQQFFNRQNKLADERFTPAPGEPDFDLIFLHICSLAWADLRFAKQTQHPLLQNADFIFTHFNSATSYSGPAALRLMRSTCGQPRHKDLYKTADQSCLLFNQLNRAGYTVQIGLNHNGAFDNFRQEVIDNLGTPATQPIEYNSVAEGTIAFDGSPVARDGDYLRAWWNQRIQKHLGPVAYYYNTITLHDGNKIPNSDLNSVQSYPIRVQSLLDDIDGLISLIKKSGRRAMVIVVPEHGAGMTGEYGQLVGLRELPTPAITEIPVLGYWIDPNYVREKRYTFPIKIKQPTSYYALNELIARWLALTPTDQDRPPWSQVVAGLQTTRYVSQQGNITIMDDENQYLIKTPGEAWKPLGPAKGKSE